MAITVALQPVSGRDRTIPVPSRPAKSDTDPSRYIPRGMSDKDKAALREAALEWTDTLGGFFATYASGRRPAADNINHYRHGGGKDRSYGESATDELQNTMNAEGKATDRSVASQFLKLIAERMQAGGDITQKFLSLNMTAGSPNYGTNWFGVTAEGKTSWYYAVGSFKMAYGAHAVRKGAETTIRYRLFIYDRYNWDIEGAISKAVTIPSSVEYALDEDEIEGAESLQFNRYQKYFEKSGETYTVTDALMGSLITTGDAHNFDIVGAGTIHYAVFRDGTTTAPDGSKLVATPKKVKEGTGR